jgi:hypothetical protein
MRQAEVLLTPNEYAKMNTQNNYGKMIQNF